MSTQSMKGAVTRLNIENGLPDIHFTLPNATKYTTYFDKKILQNKTEQVIWK